MAEQVQKQRTSTRREAAETVEGKPGDLELLKRIEEILDEVEEVLEENEEKMTSPECATCPCGYAPEECWRWRAYPNETPLSVKGPDHWSHEYKEAYHG